MPLYNKDCVEKKSNIDSAFEIFLTLFQLHSHVQGCLWLVNWAICGTKMSLLTLNILISRTKTGPTSHFSWFSVNFCLNRYDISVQERTVDVLPLTWVGSCLMARNIICRCTGSVWICSSIYTVFKQPDLSMLALDAVCNISILDWTNWWKPNNQKEDSGVWGAVRTCDLRSAP